MRLSYVFLKRKLFFEQLLIFELEFYFQITIQNCIINSESKYTKPDVFTQAEGDNVFYLETGCGGGAAAGPGAATPGPGAAVTPGLGAGATPGSPFIPAPIATNATKCNYSD